MFTGMKRNIMFGLCPFNPGLLEFSIENLHLDIWNKQLHQSFPMSRVSLDNSIFIEFPELYRQVAHFCGSWGG